MSFRKKLLRRFALIGVTAVAATGILERTVSAQPAFVALHSFTGGINSGGVSSLIQATDGDFYGVTRSGGTSDIGTVFRMTAAGTVTFLHDFVGATTDGAFPLAVIQATDGNFYGTTQNGGASGNGTIFRMSPTGTVTILHSFAGSAWPQAGLVQSTDGNFYGTTIADGAYNSGTVFRMSPDGSVTVLHSFTGGMTDGAYPWAAVIQATDGDFYGTTSLGGSSADAGIVFKITSSGTYTILHVFSRGPADGSCTCSALIQATDGNFYGTTTFGGVGIGTIFRMTPGGAVTVMHSFTGGSTDGLWPSAALIQATDGNFYSTTSGGGAGGEGYGHGTIFRMTPAGTVTLLHTFIGGRWDGLSSGSALLQATDGNLYGTADGGASDHGMVFLASGTTSPSARLTGRWVGFAPDGLTGSCGADITLHLTQVGTILRGTTTMAHAANGCLLSSVELATGQRLPSYVAGTVGAGTVSFNIIMTRLLNGVPQSFTTIVASGTFTANGLIVSGEYVALRQWTNPAGNLIPDCDLLNTAANGECAAASSPIPQSVALTAARQAADGDFDGDGKFDLTVFRPSIGQWLVLKSSTFATYGAVSWVSAPTSLCRATLMATARSIQRCTVRPQANGSC